MASLCFFVCGHCGNSFIDILDSADIYCPSCQRQVESAAKEIGSVFYGIGNLEEELYGIKEEREEEGFDVGVSALFERIPEVESERNERLGSINRLFGFEEE